MNTDTSSSISISSIYHVGDLVQLHCSGIRAWILDISTEELVCSLRYEIGGAVEHSVPLSSFRVVSAVSSTESRSGQIRNHTVPPSIRTSLQNTSETASDTPAAITALKVEYQNLKEAIKSSYTFGNTRRSHTPLHPLYTFLKQRTSLPRGWIHDIIEIPEPTEIRANERNEEDKKKQMTKKQNTIFLTILSMFSPTSSIRGIFKGWQKLTNHAFDICNKKASRCIDKYINDDFTIERKIRSDRGNSIFTNDAKRKQTFTAYNTYKRRRCAEYRESAARIPENELREDFDNLTDDAKEAYEALASTDYERSKYLWSELEEFLLKSKGKVSYCTMAAHLGNIVSHKTLIRILKEQEGFYLRKDRILPSLDDGKRQLRLIWAETFWLFYLSVAAIPTSVARIVLLHFDEKWFYAAVARTNCKVLTSIGLEPTDYYTRHKNFLHKEMYAVFTAFVLNDNDITKGGKPINVECIRIGKMLPAKRDSYKRVYKDDGTYTMLRIPENKLRTKGELYFESLNLTGNSDGTADKPTVSLLKLYKEQVIPAIETKIIEKFSENGRVKVIIVKQEDSAGAHCNKGYSSEMQKIFKNKDWIIFNQPPQSPITNVHDACIFPMMSKKVSSEQAVTFGSRLLKGEQLHKTVLKVWNDQANTQAIARAFAGHHQIVETIRTYKGDNKFLTEKGGLTFGVRRTFICDEDGSGVVPVTIAPQNETETAAGRLLHERRAAGLKYAPPKANELPRAELSIEMKEMLLEYMDPALMGKELHEVWYQLSDQNNRGDQVRE